jgi:hypothetical protein
MELYDFINRMNYVLKPQLQSNRITHITDVCNIHAIPDKQAFLAIDFPGICPGELRAVIMASISKEAGDYGFEIANTVDHINE